MNSKNHKPYKRKLFTTCKICGEKKKRNEVRLSKTGTIKERICKLCSDSYWKEFRKKFKGQIFSKPYRKYKINKCAICGFTGHFSQMDIHHIDGNHKNNKESNLQTLCANCHRLVSFNNKQF